MTNKVLLNNVDHADLRVITRHGPEFGDSVNQVLVFPREFEDLQREYPIFFRQDANGDYQAVALLGLDKDENLFLGADGWNARYVPAAQQRGPFSIVLQAPRPGTAGEPEAMIHIDLDHPRVSWTEGEPLFLPAGGNAPYLQHVSRLLGTLFDGLEAGGPFFETLDQLGLIEPVEVEATLTDGTAYVIPGLFTVSEARLAAVAGQDLERLHRSGTLRAAYAVLSSLGNVSSLIDAKLRKSAGR
ncbi:MAG: peptide ABC transporter permease [Phenylobacterium sp. RIFCSPHIGHO2_01_FULL_69_31]|uniref:SapC family protein n=1 Tax=Phenylobacterium sp. RIFCSPHIGHO2_01_FULL_69_31 TaxID=1801944 RepID=UPI0008CC6F2E|nr:SapC family protein [Phenylobacterium sp. RIFCSPHIGHO2_01_FULL_69_31]OHB31999.1 MAG: peptide ABC transporter permease [Phenylobacterium sp. RIFCSPHIGHO2_01_FULL_69_31]